MNKYIHKCVAQGKVTVPPSKSMAHRALICAALAEGESVLSSLSLCDDVRATIDALISLGAKITMKDNSAIISGGIAQKSAPEALVLDAGESGSTLRFLLPLALLKNTPITFRGKGQLLKRPMQPYYKLFDELGIYYKAEEQSITVKGQLKGNVYTVEGDVSSQFISGLLFALPLLKEDSKLILLPPIVSRPYIDMTIAMLDTFGVSRHLP